MHFFTPSQQRMIELWASFSEFQTPFLLADAMAYTAAGRDALEVAYTAAVNVYLANRGDLLADSVVEAWAPIDAQINQIIRDDIGQLANEI